MIKGVWQETLCTFFNTSCIIHFFYSSRVWILSKPSATESCCLFVLAPSSYCGLGTSARIIITLISSTAAAPWCFLCLLWPEVALSRPEAAQVPLPRSPCPGPKRGQRAGSPPTLTPSCPTHREGILEIRSYMLDLLKER